MSCTVSSNASTNKLSFSSDQVKSSHFTETWIHYYNLFGSYNMPTEVSCCNPFLTSTHSWVHRYDMLITNPVVLSNVSGLCCIAIFIIVVSEIASVGCLFCVSLCFCLVYDAVLQELIRQQVTCDLTLVLMAPPTCNLILNLSIPDTLGTQKRCPYFQGSFIH